VNLLTLELPDITQFLPTFLAFARITGLLHAMPVISTRVVPRQVRVLLGVLLAFLVGPSLPTVPEELVTTLPMLGLSFVAELAVGLAMGFAASLPIHAFEMAGAIVGFHAGFSNAVLFDPVTQSSSVLASRIFQISGFLAFLSFDLHHHIIVGLVESFSAIGPGAGVVATGAAMPLTERVGALFLEANRISMPVFAATLFLNIGWSLVTRFAQQMNVYFTAGMGVNAVVGVMATAACVPSTILLIRNAGPGLRELMAAVIGGR
jgi:flagellar biosynthetic protein FliR